MITKIKVQRRSVRPNKFGSWTYVISDKREEVAKLLEDIDGVRTIEDTGETLLWSPNRIGRLNQDTMCEFRLVETDDGKYLNLVDTSNDSLGEFMDKVKFAASFGTTPEAAVLAVESFVRLSGGLKQVATTTAPAVRENVPAEDEDTNTTPEPPKGEGAEQPVAGTEPAGKEK